MVVEPVVELVVESIIKKIETEFDTTNIVQVVSSSEIDMSPRSNQSVAIEQTIKCEKVSEKTVAVGDASVELVETLYDGVQIDSDRKLNNCPKAKSSQLESKDSCFQANTKEERKTKVLERYARAQAEKAKKDTVIELDNCVSEHLSSDDKPESELIKDLRLAVVYYTRRMTPIISARTEDQAMLQNERVSRATEMVHTLNNMLVKALRGECLDNDFDQLPNVNLPNVKLPQYMQKYIKKTSEPVNPKRENIVEPKREEQVVSITEMIKNKAYDHRSFRLCMMIPNKWFDDSKNIWKITGYFAKATHKNTDKQLGTYLCVLKQKTRNFNIDRAVVDFNNWIDSKYHPIGESDLRRIAGSDPNYQAWKDRYIVSETEEVKNKISTDEEEVFNKKKLPLDILKDKLLSIVKDRFRREFQTGVIYEKKLSYYYTRKYDDPSIFLNDIFAAEPVYHSCKSKDHHELIYFIKNITNPAFEFMKIDYDYIGFKNGIYDLNKASFIPTNEINTNIQVRKYIDQNFEILDDTPLLDGYLQYQFDAETIEFLYFMLGRLMTRLTDKFDFMVMLYGLGGSGKSLLMNLIKYVYGHDQTGILSNSFQDRFGLSEFAHKQIVCCDDMPSNMAKTVPKSDFLSMMTRGALSCPVKGKSSIEVHDWNIGTIINSNKLPNYSDESGEIVRRVMILNFENVVEESKRNIDLESQIINSEIGTFIHRCRSTYVDFVQKYKGRGVESFCPLSFIENRNLLRLAVNSTYQFISDRYEYKESTDNNQTSVTVPELNREFKMYIRELYDMKKTPKDNINIQSILAVDARFSYERTTICKHCRSKHRKGCCSKYQRTERSTRDTIWNMVRVYPSC